MTHPWLKKNPFMSLWLSGANRVAGSMRGHAAAQAQRQAAQAQRQAAQAQRQAAAAMTDATRDILTLWTGALAPSPPAKRKKKRR
jgi:membrane protease subunit (stomatin/prohibitin family)